MHIFSYNVNNIRARLPDLQAVIEKYQPDIIGLQETKVADDQFREEEINNLGYQVQYHGQSLIWS